jgi:hypothetical protein
MAEPDWNPDTAGRSLAEILREAGIEAPRSGRRGRRWDDEDTGIRQRGAAAPAPAPDGVGRRAGDLRVTDDRPAADRPPRDRSPRDRPLRDRPAEDPPGGRAAPPRRAADPSTAAIPGLRPSRTPDVPGPSTPPPAPRDRRGTETDRRERDRRSPEPDPSWQGPERRVAERRSSERREGERRAPARAPREEPAGRPRDTGRVSDRPLRRPAGEDFSTGPIPVVRDGDPVLTEEEAGPRESALAWLRFAGELVIALAAGIGVYFLATVLWEQVPQLAVFLAPLAVTGLVAGVSVWRQRLGREPVGARLLAVLVFAGALLTVAPAAGLLAAG